MWFQPSSGVKRISMGRSRPSRLRSLAWICSLAARTASRSPTLTAQAKNSSIFYSSSFGSASVVMALPITIAMLPAGSPPVSWRCLQPRHNQRRMLLTLVEVTPSTSSNFFW